MTTQLRPLSLSELLDRTFQLYRQHFMLFVGIVALPQLVLLTLQLTGVVSGGLRGSRPGLTLLWSFALLVVSLFVATTVQAATIVAVSQLQLGRPVTIGLAYAQVRTRILPLVFVAVAVGFLIGLGLVLLIIPGVLLALRWSLAVPAAVLETLPAGQAMSRSADLTRGDWGRVFMIYVLYTFLLLVGTSLWQVPTMAVTFKASLAGVPPPLWALIVNYVGAFFTQCLICPIITIALSLLYYDERVRKEAFDLQHMIAELGDSGAPA